MAKITSEKKCQMLLLLEFYYWQRKIRHLAIEKSRVVSEKKLPGFATLEPPAEKFSCMESAAAQTSDARTVNASPAVVLCCADYRLLLGDSISEQTLKTVLRAIKNA